MTRAMLLAALLFDPYRTPAILQQSPGGDLDEAMHVTPAMFARMLRILRGWP